MEIAGREPIIEFRQLGLRYGDHQALAGISARIYSKDCVVICGPSGSGKSSLLRCVNGLEGFQEGDVIVRGISVRGCQDLPKLRYHVGLVFQRFELYPHMTCLSNVTLALRKVLRLSRAEAERRAKEVLNRFGVVDQADKYPAQLSGGQQQRIAICRSLVLEPDVMMFDEPTSALDPEMIDDVLQVLLQLVREGMTMLIVTHEMQFARDVATRIIFMEKGRIVEHGSKEEFFSSTRNPRTQAFLDRVFKEKRAEEAHRRA
jgi:ABC-type polar amino acid transport system ATPase subunit